MLVLAGIWGEERNPQNWFTKGLIKNANKYLNLIHVNDIIYITKLCIDRLLSGDQSLIRERINLSDGKPYFDADLAKLYNSQVPFLDEADLASKKLNNSKLLNILSLFDHSFTLLITNEI